MLHDSRYTPLFGSEKPKAQDKKPAILRKLEEVVELKNGSLTLRNTKPPEPSKSSPLEVPQRVMVGGADSMEHLIPKSP